MASFEFKWNNEAKFISNNSNKASGKAFARKKNNKKLSEIADNPERVTEIQKSIKRQTGKLDLNKNNTEEINNVGKKLEPQKFIKRKGKKDKLATKISNQSLENEDQTSKVQKTIHQQPATSQRSLFSEKYKNVYINTNIKGKSVVEKVFSAGKKISDLDIHRHIISNLEKNNFNILTNVQEKSIPTVLSGQNVLIRSQTGSGKTLAYAVPILNALVNITPKLQRSNGVQAIIVVPTRELATQTHELFAKLNTFQWIVVGLLCGGENRKTEKVRLKKGVHILIGTPGRLLDHVLHTTAFNAKHVRCLVLDEADRLLDMGFKKDIVRFVEELDSQKNSSTYDPMAIFRGQKLDEETPADKQTSVGTIPPLQDPNSNIRQTILLSATLTKGIAELADFTMKEHVYIDALDESATTNPEHLIIPNTVKQEFILTFVKHRLVMLSALLITKSKRNSKTFVFMATSHMVDFHYELFQKYLLRMPKDKGKMKVGNVLLLDDVEFDDSDEEEDVLDIELFKLHGSMNQNERKEVFNGFRKAKKGVLLCTDVVARGIDVPEAESIIQYTGPQTIDDYIHRVGRTGRAGKSGSAVIFLAHEEQEFISCLQEHKVFLNEHKSDDILANLTIFMEEPDHEKATLALQRRYESAISKDKDLHKKACFAYSSWSRFYSSFPTKMKSIFDFKKVNLGHFVTSFGLHDTPTTVAKIVRGQVSKAEPKRLNKKLDNHQYSEATNTRKQPKKRPIKSLSLTTSEYSSGLEPAKKKKKKKSD